jgi:hypothetical protein
VYVAVDRFGRRQGSPHRGVAWCSSCPGAALRFRSDNEGIDSAVRRVTAELVLFDCALGISTCAEIAATARLEGARLLMFSASHTEREARDIASLYGAVCFVLPVKPREFMELVDRALGTTIAT